MVWGESQIQTLVPPFVWRYAQDRGEREPKAMKSVKTRFPIVMIMSMIMIIMIIKNIGSIIIIFDCIYSRSK